MITHFDSLTAAFAQLTGLTLPAWLEPDGAAFAAIPGDGVQAILAGLEELLEAAGQNMRVDDWLAAEDGLGPDAPNRLFQLFAHSVMEHTVYSSYGRWACQKAAVVCGGCAVVVILVWVAYALLGPQLPPAGLPALACSGPAACLATLLAAQAAYHAVSVARIYQYEKDIPYRSSDIKELKARLVKVDELLAENGPLRELPLSWHLASTIRTQLERIIDKAVWAELL